jgi:hypothetical protein
MDSSKFRSSPWRTSHPAYDDSPISVSPAPEFATGEVVLASLTRAIGFGISERDVPAAGKKFDKNVDSEAKHKALGNRTTVGFDTWRTVVHGILESPKQPAQSSKRFLQLSPIVPDIGLYSGTARASAGSWRPALLVQRMIQIGSATPADAERLWSKTFKALTVSEDDDVWARWLQQEFVARRFSAEWRLREFESKSDLTAADKESITLPARRFVADFEAVLDAKESMTRRQWITILESVLRLGTVAHVLWLCNANKRIWRLTSAALQGEKPAAGAVARALSQNESVLVYGNPAAKQVRDLTSFYLIARLGLNATLWELADRLGSNCSLSTIEDIERFLGTVYDERTRITARVEATLRDLLEEHARAISCKKGVGTNLTEFVRHVLGQRQTASDALRGYDQGYLLRKKAEYASAPWVVSLGPVSVLALVHCCLRGAAGPRSIHRLSQHLGEYGLAVDRDDIAGSELGQKLRMLGLVLDSPDAESGMLLVSPFEGRHAVSGGAV